MGCSDKTQGFLLAAAPSGDSFSAGCWAASELVLSRGCFLLDTCGSRSSPGKRQEGRRRKRVTACLLFLRLGELINAAEIKDGSCGVAWAVSSSNYLWPRWSRRGLLKMEAVFGSKLLLQQLPAIASSSLSCILTPSCILNPFWWEKGNWG